MSGPFRDTAVPAYTWATRPDPAQFPGGTIIFISDMGLAGSYWYPTATRWRPVNGSVFLFTLPQPTVLTGANTETLLASTPIPRGLIKAGDTLRITVAGGRVGQTASSTFRARLGSNPSAFTDTTVMTLTGPSVGTTVASFAAQQEFTRTGNATELVQSGLATAYNSLNGSSTIAIPSPVTVPNLDSTDGLLLSFTYTPSSASETMTMRPLYLEFVANGGA